MKHLEKLLARDGETGKALRALSGKGSCVDAVCEGLRRIGTKAAIRALAKAARSGRYGRLPADILYLARQDIEKAARRALLAQSSPQAKPVAKRAPAKKPATRPKRAVSKPRAR